MEDKVQTPSSSTTPQPPHKPWFKIIIVLGIIGFFFMLAVSVFIIIKLVRFANQNKPEVTVSQTPVASSTHLATQTAKKSATVKQNSNSPAATEQPSQENSEPTKSNNDIIDYFIDTAVYDYSKRELFVKRWTASSVSVGVAEGEFTESLNNCLGSFISDFNAQSSSTKLRRDDTVDLGIPNIKIYYWPDDQFNNQ